MLWFFFYKNSISLPFTRLNHHLLSLWSWIKAGFHNCRAKNYHCSIEPLTWQLLIWTSPSIVEPRFLTYSSFGTSLCICFSSTRPNNHCFITAPSKRLVFDSLYSWNHAMLIKDPPMLIILNFESWEMVVYWERNMDLKFVGQMLLCSFLSC